ncbi:MAG: hypothetical protein HKN19_18360, partial [Halioglobus sp.]|nr:hypothetical protein [Halioglobus sp.]
MHTAVRLLLLSIILSALAACSDGNDNFPAFFLLPGCADNNSCVANPALEIGGERPAQVWIPSDYDPNKRYPLLVVLHGFGVNGLVQAAYMGFINRVDNFQFIMVAPDGTLNEGGLRFWNATPACCAGDRTDIDDVGYISGLIREAAATYSVDASRVALFGHSNGGFMALRMACEASELVTTVVNLAGSAAETEEMCAPATYPVSVMALHGTLDATIPYNGSESRGFPSAPETARRYAVLAGCDTSNTSMDTPIDMDQDVPG